MLSIVIPTFNSQRHVRRCLDSILGQTYRDWEVVVKDGGSTDGTVEIVKDIAAADGRVVLCEGRDAGVYDAYNQGLARARGHWLLFLGSDDELYAPTTLAEIAPYLVEDYDLVYGNVLMCGDTTWAKSGTVFDGEYSLAKLGRQNISHQAVFYHRDLFSRFGHYDLRFKVLADWAFNLRVFRHCRRKYVETIVARFHAGGLSTQRRDEEFQNHYFDLVRECFDFAPLHPFFSTYASLLPHLATSLRRQRRYGRALQYWLLHFLHASLLPWKRRLLGG